MVLQMEITPSVACLTLLEHESKPIETASGVSQIQG